MNIRHTLFLISVLAIGLPGGVAFADPPPWAPAHGHPARVEHRYVYYPAHQVYYSPQQRVWFWNNGGAWQSGASLPVHFRIAGEGVSITLQSEQPHMEHVYVERQYGEPWRAKHAHAVNTYQYVYYPQHHIYYAPASHTWFWKAGDHWHFGSQLPRHYRVHHDRDGVPVSLRSSRPFTEHVYVEEHYGKPWRAKHRKHRDRDDD